MPASSGPAYIRTNRIRNGAAKTQAINRPRDREGPVRRPVFTGTSVARADGVGLLLHDLGSLGGRGLQQRHLLDLGLKHPGDLLPGGVRRWGLGGLERL